MTLQEVLGSLNDNVRVDLFTEDDDDKPAAVYDGRNSIDSGYNSRKVRFITVGNRKAEIGVYGLKM